MKLTLILQCIVFSAVLSAIVVFLTIGFERVIDGLDDVLNPCQHGTDYIGGECSCYGTPFKGKFCSTCNCSNGFCSLTSVTTPKISSDYGCVCPMRSKYFGFLCDQCNAVDDACEGECKEGYHGNRCERVCYADITTLTTTDCGLINHVATGNTIEEISGTDECGCAQQCLDSTHCNSFEYVAWVCYLKDGHTIQAGVGHANTKTNIQMNKCSQTRQSGGVCNTCNGHGTCKDGFCECDPDWYSVGGQCTVTCSSCSGHGKCILYGQKPGCKCDTGYTGQNCDIVCPGMETGAPCAGHGRCVLTDDVTSCVCDNMYRGDACDIRCPGRQSDCNGHGICGETGVCACTGTWTGEACNCSDALTCNSNGVCINGECQCNDNFGGSTCLECKEHFYGEDCDKKCIESEATTADALGCYNRGRCAIFDLGKRSEYVGCTCNSEEYILKEDGRVDIFQSTYSSDLNCEDCPADRFPKLNVFLNELDETLPLYIPCQQECYNHTCNNLGICNVDYGRIGASLCTCDDHIDDSSFCTECEEHWYPKNVNTGCNNFCISDIATLGEFPEACDGSISCVQCGGNGKCSPDGVCVCNDGHTGEECQIECGDNCSGHGTCKVNELQRLLQYELEYVVGSGALYTCECDPQDVISDQSKKDFTGTLTEPPKKEYYGEECGFYCVKPPWKGADECNGMGNCTVFPIEKDFNEFSCQSDDDCDSAEIRSILNGDPDWSDKKGPFCQKEECSLCEDYIRLQRPAHTRSKHCTQDQTCREFLHNYDWYSYCNTAIDNADYKAGAESCGSMTQFCSGTVNAKCAGYTTMGTTSSGIIERANICYESDKTQYPSQLSENFRGVEIKLHDELYSSGAPTVNISVKEFCPVHMRRFGLNITKVDTNRRYRCGNTIISDPIQCLYGLEEVEHLPFAIKCPNEEDVLFANLDDAIKQRGMGCKVAEVEPRELSEPTVDTSCKRGTVWNGIECENAIFTLYVEIDSGAQKNMISKEECKEYADKTGNSWYGDYEMETDPPGCWLYHDGSVYYNDAGSLNTVCSSNFKCIQFISTPPQGMNERINIRRTNTSPESMNPYSLSKEDCENYARSQSKEFQLDDTKSGCVVSGDKYAWGNTVVGTCSNGCIERIQPKQYILSNDQSDLTRDECEAISKLEQKEFVEGYRELTEYGKSIFVNNYVGSESPTTVEECAVHCADYPYFSFHTDGDPEDCRCGNDLNDKGAYSVTTAAVYTSLIPYKCSVIDKIYYQSTDKSVVCGTHTCISSMVVLPLGKTCSTHDECASANCCEGTCSLGCNIGIAHTVTEEECLEAATQLNLNPGFSSLQTIPVLSKEQCLEAKRTMGVDGPTGSSFDEYSYTWMPSGCTYYNANNDGFERILWNADTTNGNTTKNRRVCMNENGFVILDTPHATCDTSLPLGCLHINNRIVFNTIGSGSGTNSICKTDAGEYIIGPTDCVINDIDCGDLIWEDGVGCVDSINMLEGLALIDDTCNNAVEGFPRCRTPLTPCEVNPCNGDDICYDGENALCETLGILNCTCKFNQRCETETFSTYRCITPEAKAPFRKGTCTLTTAEEERSVSILGESGCKNEGFVPILPYEIQTSGSCVSVSEEICSDFQWLGTPTMSTVSVESGRPGVQGYIMSEEECREYAESNGYVFDFNNNNPTGCVQTGDQVRYSTGAYSIDCDSANKCVEKTMDMEVTREDLPSGCIKRMGVVMFNTATTAVQCSGENNCLCSVPYNPPIKVPYVLGEPTEDCADGMAWLGTNMVAEETIPFPIQNTQAVFVVSNHICLPGGFQLLNDLGSDMDENKIRCKDACYQHPDCVYFRLNRQGFSNDHECEGYESCRVWLYQGYSHSLYQTKYLYGEVTVNPLHTMIRIPGFDSFVYKQGFVFYRYVQTRVEMVYLQKNYDRAVFVESRYVNTADYDPTAFESYWAGGSRYTLSPIHIKEIILSGCPLNFTKNKGRSCVEMSTNMNWFDYCATNNPVVYSAIDGVLSDTGLSIVVQKKVEHIRFWTKPTFSSSGFLEIEGNDNNILVRLFFQKGQMQLNSVGLLNSCPVDDNTCLDTFAFTENEWVYLHMQFDFTAQTVTLKGVTKPFIASEDGFATLYPYIEKITATPSYKTGTCQSSGSELIIRNRWCDGDFMTLSTTMTGTQQDRIDTCRQLCHITDGCAYYTVFTVGFSVQQLCYGFLTCDDYRWFGNGYTQYQGYIYGSFRNPISKDNSVLSSPIISLEAQSEEECAMQCYLKEGCSNFFYDNGCFQTEECNQLKATYFDEVLLEVDIDPPPLATECSDFDYCDVDISYREKCTDLLQSDYPLLVEPTHDILEVCSLHSTLSNMSTVEPDIEEEILLRQYDWDKYCLFYTRSYDETCTETQEYLEEFTECKPWFESLENNTITCMAAVLADDMTEYCSTAIPQDLKDNCPVECYNSITPDNCEERSQMFSDNKGNTSGCPSFDYCYDVAMGRDEGVCSAVECKCNTERNDGVSGVACELQCNTGADGTACGEGSGVGKCVYRPEDKAIYDSGNDVDGHWIAWQENKMEILGQCQCVSKEGASNCDLECLNCNERSYSTILKQPDSVGASYIFNVTGTVEGIVLKPQWLDETGSITGSTYSAENLDHCLLVCFDFMFAYFDTDCVCSNVLDGGNNIIKRKQSIQNISITTGKYTEYITPYVPYTTETCDSPIHTQAECELTGTWNGTACLIGTKLLCVNDFINIHGSDFVVTLDTDSAPFVALHIAQGGKHGVCEGSSGFCDCLPPYVSMVHETTYNWKGTTTTALVRSYDMPSTTPIREMTIRMMQGKQPFIEYYLKYVNGTTPTGDWSDIYKDFRDAPEHYKCAKYVNGVESYGPCSSFEFNKLGSLSDTSPYYNYDCKSVCPGTVDHIPCSGHGRCATSGQCVCESDIASASIQIGDFEESNLAITKFDSTGWRGEACELKCPGYDEFTRSMENVCNGHGVCNNAAECECQMGYIGTECEFKCPGFTEGEDSVCSGHGKCEFSVIEAPSTLGSSLGRRLGTNCVYVEKWTPCVNGVQYSTVNILEYPMNGGSECPTPGQRECYNEYKGCSGYWLPWNNNKRTFNIVHHPVKGTPCPLSPQIMPEVYNISCEGHCTKCVATVCYDCEEGYIQNMYGCSKIPTLSRPTLRSSSCNDTNCHTCNDGTLVYYWREVPGKTYTTTGETAKSLPLALQECGENTACVGVTGALFEWYISTTDTVVDANFTIFEKVYDADQACVECKGGSVYNKERKKCVPSACDPGYEWEDGEGCVEDTTGYSNIQRAVRVALNAASCTLNTTNYTGGFIDKSGVCVPVSAKPIIQITQKIDEGKIDEISETFDCRVLTNNKVECAQCECFSDYLYGRWASFECETCDRGYGDRQCKTSCPAYDGVNTATMCSGEGKCSFGSLFNGTRYFQDASCTCGSPPGSYNEAGDQMTLYSTFYNELNTVSEVKYTVECLEDELAIASGFDFCYHYDEDDCSSCTELYSGKNCQYRCQNCLLGGSCTSTPSGLVSAECSCPRVYGTNLDVWSFNCCPVGFRVRDIITFNELTKDVTAQISMPQSITSVNENDSGSASYWCKACPGVDEQQWLSPSAIYNVCGGISRGTCVTNYTNFDLECECHPENNIGEDVNKDGSVTSADDWGGFNCRCNHELTQIYTNIYTDYGCFGNGICSPVSPHTYVNDGRPTYCLPHDGYFISGEYAQISEVQAGYELNLTKSFVVEYTGKTYYYGQQPCQPGMYQRYSKQTIPCVPCLFGSYSTGGSTGCTPVSTGHESDQGVITGIVNVWGYDAIENGMMYPMTYDSQTDQTTREPHNEPYKKYSAQKTCDPGTFQNEEGQEFCKICSPGRYQNEEGQIECKNCSPGQYQNEQGQAGCIDCISGRYQNEEAQITCIQCANGQYQTEIGQPQCDNVPVGHFSHADHQFYIDSSTNNIMSYYVACVDTKIAYQNEAGQDHCKQCQFGFYSTGTACSDCHRDSPNTGLVLKQDILWTTFDNIDISIKDSATCETCGAGRYAVKVDYVRAFEGIAAIMPNQFKKLKDDFNTSHEYIHRENSTENPTGYDDGFGPFCEKCPVGFFQDQPGSAYCEPCALNEYQNEEGKTSCKTCPNLVNTDILKLKNFTFQGKIYNYIDPGKTFELTKEECYEAKLTLGLDGPDGNNFFDEHAYSWMAPGCTYYNANNDGFERILWNNDGSQWGWSTNDERWKSRKVCRRLGQYVVLSSSYESCDMTIAEEAAAVDGKVDIEGRICPDCDVYGHVPGPVVGTYPNKGAWDCSGTYNGVVNTYPTYYGSYRDAMVYTENMPGFSNTHTNVYCWASSYPARNALHNCGVAQYVPDGSLLSITTVTSTCQCRLTCKTLSNCISYVVIDTQCYTLNGPNTLQPLPQNIPSWMTLPVVDISDRGPNPTNLGRCEGDCDTNSDCLGILICFQREEGGEVPGCTGIDTVPDVSSIHDICIYPFQNVVNYIGTGSALCETGCALCETGCNTDSDCVGNLVCCQPNSENMIPGCYGKVYTGGVCTTSCDAPVPSFAEVQLGDKMLIYSNRFYSTITPYLNEVGDFSVTREECENYANVNGYPFRLVPESHWSGQDGGQREGRPSGCQIWDEPTGDDLTKGEQHVNFNYAGGYRVFYNPTSTAVKAGDDYSYTYGGTVYHDPVLFVVKRYVEQSTFSHILEMEETSVCKDCGVGYMPISIVPVSTTSGTPQVQYSILEENEYLGLDWGSSNQPFHIITSKIDEVCINCLREAGAPYYSYKVFMIDMYSYGNWGKECLTTHFNNIPANATYSDGTPVFINSRLSPSAVIIVGIRKVGGVEGSPGYIKKNGVHCNYNSNNAHREVQYGTISSDACRETCTDQHTNCVAYYTKPNEYCIIYSECISYDDGNTEGGDLYQKQSFCDEDNDCWDVECMLENTFNRVYPNSVSPMQTVRGSIDSPVINGSCAKPCHESWASEYLCRNACATAIYHYSRYTETDTDKTCKCGNSTSGVGLSYRAYINTELTHQYRHSDNYRYDSSVYKIYMDPDLTTNEFASPPSNTYVQKVGMHCNHNNNTELIQYGPISGDACQTKCDNDETCVAYAHMSTFYTPYYMNGTCTIYKLCAFEPKDTGTEVFFQKQVSTPSRICKSCEFPMWKDTSKGETPICDTPVFRPNKIGTFSYPHANIISDNYRVIPTCPDEYCMEDYEGGYIYNPHTYPTICTTGAYLLDNECVQTSPGHYQDAGGKTYQLACEPGSYASSPGQSTCTPCDIDTYQPDGGKSSCINVDTGYYAPSGSTDQIECVGGDLSPGVCTPCVAGTFEEYPDDNYCTDCSPGDYQDEEGAIICKVCPPGEISNAGSSTCAPCPVGTYESSNVCVDCPAGEESTEGSTSCTECPINEVSNGGEVCSECANTLIEFTTGTGDLSLTEDECRNHFGDKFHSVTSSDVNPTGCYLWNDQDAHYNTDENENDCQDNTADGRVCVRGVRAIKIQSFTSGQGDYSLTEAECQAYAESMGTSADVSNSKSAPMGCSYNPSTGEVLYKTEYYYKVSENTDCSTGSYGQKYGKVVYDVNSQEMHIPACALHCSGDSSCSVFVPTYFFPDQSQGTCSFYDYCSEYSSSNGNHAFQITPFVSCGSYQCIKKPKTTYFTTDSGMSSEMTEAECQAYGESIGKWDSTNSWDHITTGCFKNTESGDEVHFNTNVNTIACRVGKVCVHKTCKCSPGQYVVGTICVDCPVGHSCNGRTKSVCSFIRPYVRTYGQKTGMNCNYNSGADFVQHGGIGGDECRTKCDNDESCVAYASNPGTWCTTYKVCTFQSGDTWGGTFFQKQDIPVYYTPLEPGTNCNAGGLTSNYIEYGSGFSNEECQTKCDNDETCVAYATKTNEFCTTYKVCLFQFGSHYDGQYYRKVATNNAYQDETGQSSCKRLTQDGYESVNGILTACSSGKYSSPIIYRGNCNVAGTVVPQDGLLTYDEAVTAATTECDIQSDCKGFQLSVSTQALKQFQEDKVYNKVEWLNTDLPVPCTNDVDLSLETAIIGTFFYDKSYIKGTCTACPAGMYTDVSASTRCLFCPVGKYQSTPGLTKCDHYCDDTDVDKFVTFLTDGAPTETWDPSQAVAHTCSDCLKGKFSMNNNPDAPQSIDSNCIACPSGTHSLGVKCSYCPAGTYARETVGEWDDIWDMEVSTYPGPLVTFTSTDIMEYNGANSTTSTENSLETGLYCNLCPGKVLGTLQDLPPNKYTIYGMDILGGYLNEADACGTCPTNTFAYNAFDPFVTRAYNAPTGGLDETECKEYGESIYDPMYGNKWRQVITNSYTLMDCTYGMQVTDSYMSNIVANDGRSLLCGLSFDDVAYGSGADLTTAQASCDADDECMGVVGNKENLYYTANRSDQIIPCVQEPCYDFYIKTASMISGCYSSNGLLYYNRIPTTVPCGRKNGDTIEECVVAPFSSCKSQAGVNWGPVRNVIYTSYGGVVYVQDPNGATYKRDAGLDVPLTSIQIGSPGNYVDIRIACTHNPECVGILGNDQFYMIKDKSNVRAANESDVVPGSVFPPNLLITSGKNTHTINQSECIVYAGNNVFLNSTQSNRPNGCFLGNPDYYQLSENKWCQQPNQQNLVTSIDNNNQTKAIEQCAAYCRNHSYCTLFNVQNYSNTFSCYAYHDCSEWVDSVAWLNHSAFKMLTPGSAPINTTPDTWWNNPWWNPPLTIYYNQGSGDCSDIYTCVQGVDYSNMYSFYSNPFYNQYGCFKGHDNKIYYNIGNCVESEECIDTDYINTVNTSTMNIVHSQAHGICHRCPDGTYSDGNSRDCTMCPTGSHRTDTNTYFSTDYIYLELYGDDIISNADISTSVNMNVDECATFCTGYRYFSHINRWYWSSEANTANTVYVYDCRCANTIGSTHREWGKIYTRKEGNYRYGQQFRPTVDVAADTTPCTYVPAGYIQSDTFDMKKCSGVEYQDETGKSRCKNCPLGYAGDSCATQLLIPHLVNEAWDGNRAYLIPNTTLNIHEYTFDLTYKVSYEATQCINNGAEFLIGNRFCADRFRMSNTLTGSLAERVATCKAICISRPDCKYYMVRTGDPVSGNPPVNSETWFCDGSSSVCAWTSYQGYMHGTYRTPIDKIGYADNIDDCAYLCSRTDGCTHFTYISTVCYKTRDCNKITSSGTRDAYTYEFVHDGECNSVDTLIGTLSSTNFVQKVEQCAQMCALHLGCEDFVVSRTADNMNCYASGICEGAINDNAYTTWRLNNNMMASISNYVLAYKLRRKIQRDIYEAGTYTNYGNNTLMEYVSIELQHKGYELLYIHKTYGESMSVSATGIENCAQQCIDAVACGYFEFNGECKHINDLRLNTDDLSDMVGSNIYVPNVQIRVAFLSTITSTPVGKGTIYKFLGDTDDFNKHLQNYKGSVKNVPMETYPVGEYTESTWTANSVQDCMSRGEDRWFRDIGDPFASNYVIADIVSDNEMIAVGSSYKYKCYTFDNSFSFAVQTSGNTDSSVSYEECAQYAALKSIVWGGIIQVNEKPPGCITNGTVLFNSGYNTVSCTESNSCIVKGGSDYKIFPSRLKTFRTQYTLKECRHAFDQHDGVKQWEGSGLYSTHPPGCSSYVQSDTTHFIYNHGSGSECGTNVCYEHTVDSKYKIFKIY